MSEETNSPATELLDLYCKTMKENEEFLHRNADETYREVTDLINNAIDLIGFAIEREKSIEDFSISYSYAIKLCDLHRFADWQFTCMLYGA